MTAKRDDQEAGALITARLRDLGRSQAWLGEAIAEELGVKPISQRTVSSWILRTHTPAPEQVFAIETVLEFKPGALSRHFGYLPLAARAQGGGVDAAVKADPYLSEASKRALVAAYRELRKP